MAKRYQVAGPGHDAQGATGGRRADASARDDPALGGAPRGTERPGTVSVPGAPLGGGADGI